MSKWQNKKLQPIIMGASHETRGRKPMVNKKKYPNSPGIDLCADLSEQPIAFAQYFHAEKMANMKLKLKLTSEVLQAIEDSKKQQDAILELKNIDWSKLDETYITCFDL